MIVDLDSLSEYDFSVFKINAVRRIPTYRKCSFMSRPKNGFIYVTHGECTFESIGERISLSAGGIVLTSLVSIFLYRERLSMLQYIGMVLGIGAIVFLNI